MSVSKILILSLLNVVLCSCEMIDIVTWTNVAGTRQDWGHGYKLCCPIGSAPASYISYIYLTRPDKNGFPIVDAKYTTYFHFPDVFRRFFGTCTLGATTELPERTPQWIQNIRVSRKKWYHTSDYDTRVKKYQDKDIYVSYFGYCTKKVNLSELDKMDHFVVKYTYDDYSTFNLKCPNNKKLLIRSAIVRGDDFCGGGHPYVATEKFYNHCTGKTQCTGKIKAFLPDANNLCPGQYKSTLLKVSCVGELKQQ